MQQRRQMLVELLERDIRQRCLSPGDPYHTATKISRIYGVSRATAHRAMRDLVVRDFLHSRRGSGTIVGSAINHVQIKYLSLIHVVIPHAQRLPAAAFGDLMEGLQESFPQAGIQFNYMPESDPLQFVERLVQSTDRRQQTMGLVISSPPRDVQLLLTKCMIPVVAFGSVYADCDELPSITTTCRRTNEHPNEGNWSSVSMRECGVIGGRMLVEQIKGRLPKPRHIVMQPKL